MLMANNTSLRSVHKSNPRWTNEHRLATLCVCAYVFRSKKTEETLFKWEYFFGAIGTASLVFTIVDSELCKFIEGFGLCVKGGIRVSCAAADVVMLFVISNFKFFMLSVAMDPTFVYIFVVLVPHLYLFLLTPLFALIRIVKL